MVVGQRLPEQDCFSMTGNNRLGILFCLCQLCYSAVVHADFRDDIGYSALQTEQGAALPDGAGVPVSQVEAAMDNPPTIYLPDPNDPQFSGKTITDKSRLSTGVYSGHATGVGGRFYGIGSSLTPGIQLIDAYLADRWLGADFLRGLSGTSKPLTSPSRVANHSWVGATGNATTDSNLLRRIDWVVATDEFIQVVGTNNGTGTNPSLLSSAYNVIAVGRTDGQSTTGTPALDATYTAGRTRPDIVAPMSTTSEATPVVASAAALLVAVGHSNPALSTDPRGISTTNRRGDIIYNAERSEVIKAALMAGADHDTVNASGANITDYRVAAENQTANGLDRRFGAGQLNILNSFHIIAAGEQNSAEDATSTVGFINMNGFDYVPHFGGAGGSNGVATYRFNTAAGPSNLTASLVWNINIAGGSGSTFSGTATLLDMDLQLYDVTDGNPVLVLQSSGQLENSETILTTLPKGKQYLLVVVPGKSQAPFDGHYALAWNVKVVPIPAALPLLFSGLAGIFFVARRRTKR
jgi:hypothetical protein